MMAFAEKPSSGAVFNLGGGRSSSVSLLKAIARVEELTRRQLQSEYVDEPGVATTICYVSSLSRFRPAYPDWEIEAPLEAIFEQLMAARVAGFQD